MRMLRKSRPFWNFLSDYGIFNCILRVPITFPPEKLRGVQLSAMCVPDLRGTQGTFTLFTTRPLPQTYLRYVERTIREVFTLGPTPVKIRVRRRGE